MGELRIRHYTPVLAVAGERTEQIILSITEAAAD